MIHISEGAKQKIAALDKSKVHVLTDFDSTLTNGKSQNSWAILRHSGLMGAGYTEESRKQFEYYHPFEFDAVYDMQEKIKLMHEWWTKHGSLFTKYSLSESVVLDAAKDKSVMELRGGAVEFLTKMHVYKIPVVIISAGIGNFIEQILINNNCYFDNIFVASNFIEFKNGVAIGMKGSVIHSLNKNETALPEHVKEKLATRPNIILFGDVIEDIKMSPAELQDSALKIGFIKEKESENLEHYKNNFDIVCTDNTSFDDINKILKLY